MLRHDGVAHCPAVLGTALQDSFIYTREKMNHVTRVDERTLDVDVLQVVEWRSVPGTAKPAEEVHIMITAKNAPYPLAIRLKSREACTQLVAALIEHMNEVWPAN